MDANRGKRRLNYTYTDDLSKNEASNLFLKKLGKGDEHFYFSEYKLKNLWALLAIPRDDE